MTKIVVIMNFDIKEQPYVQLHGKVSPQCVKAFILLMDLTLEITVEVVLYSSRVGSDANAACVFPVL